MSHLPDDIPKFDWVEEDVHNILNLIPGENATQEEVIASLKQVIGILYQLIADKWGVNID